MALVEPFVHSSMFRPFPQPETMPLETYYELEPIRAAVRLLPYPQWQTLSAATPQRQRTAVLLVWSDFPGECLETLPSSAGLSRCPKPCVRRVQRELYDVYERATRGWPLTCLRADVLRRAMRRPGGVQLFRRYAAVTLLNFRRHDDRRPLVPTQQLQQQRGSTVRPSRALRGAARAFVAAHGQRYGQHAAVQLRSNHLAHAIHLRGQRGRATPGSSSSSSSSASAAAASAAVPAANCSDRLRGCLRRLSRAAAALAPPSRTVAASDLATLFRPNQDGESHRRHAYVGECLVPNAPALLGWYRSAGYAFGCGGSGGGGDGGGNGGATATAAQGLGGGGRCDAGALGLLDLVLASDAKDFAAVDVRTPWPSAFLDWIVQNRRRKGLKSTLLRCGET